MIKQNALREFYVFDKRTWQQKAPGPYGQRGGRKTEQRRPLWRDDRAMARADLYTLEDASMEHLWTICFHLTHLEL